jgi:hypothetical protein
MGGLATLGAAESADIFCILIILNAVTHIKT